MKTAMQEAFEHQKLWIESGFTLEKWFENYEQSHLKKEKEQIMDAWIDGVTNWDSEKRVADYINETFKSE